MVLSLLLVFLTILSAPVSADELTGTDLYFKQGRWQKAAAGYEVLVLQEPTAKNFKLLAESYFHEGNNTASLAAYKKASEMSDDPEIRISIALLESLRDTKPDNLMALKGEFGENPYFMRAAGVYYMQQDDYTYALQNFEMAVDANPEDFMSYYYMGKIHELTEDFDKGIWKYKRAVEINPRFAQALNNLGYCYKERHYYSYAIELYGKAIKEDPGNSGYYYNIGNAYTHKEMIPEAYESYKKAIELEPTFAKAHYNMGRTYLRYERYRDAIKEFELYIKYWTPDLSEKDVPHPDAVETEIIEIEHSLYNDELEDRSLFK